MNNNTADISATAVQSDLGHVDAWLFKTKF